MSSVDETYSLSEVPPRQLGSSVDGGMRTFCEGSLLYTPGLVVATFVWLMWGEVCMEVAKQITHTLLPVSLRDLQANNTMIGVITLGLPCILRAFMGPALGSWSDRYRSRPGWKRCGGPYHYRAPQIRIQNG